MTKHPICNFSAGPAMVPAEVLEQVQNEFTDWYHGMSVVEISHRSEPILALQDSLESLLRRLLSIPDDFVVLMMHGGARAQFSAVPLNLLNPSQKAHYGLSGYWGKVAAKTASAFGQIETTTFDIIRPELFSDLQVSKETAYLHLTDNETIEGIELPHLPQVTCPIVVDITSNILSRPIDWQKVHCAYASAQKNLGIAGAAYVIVKRDLIDAHKTVLPDILSYQVVLETQSMVNTPPVFAWYMTEKVLQWTLQQGGVSAMGRRAQQRSQALYDVIDQSDFYDNSIPPALRSSMNVPFSIKRHEDRFFQEAQEQGLFFLEGHRSVGGARASMYNAMPDACVQHLIEFMKAFAVRNG